VLCCAVLCAVLCRAVQRLQLKLQRGQTVLHTELPAAMLQLLYYGPGAKSPTAAATASHGTPRDGRGQNSGSSSASSSTTAGSSMSLDTNTGLPASTATTAATGGSAAANGSKAVGSGISPTAVQRAEWSRLKEVSFVCVVWSCAVLGILACVVWCAWCQELTADVLAPPLPASFQQCTRRALLSGRWKAHRLRRPGPRPAARHRP
jgi:cobalamin biosynthesis Mg chelatase CobN